MSLVLKEKKVLDFYNQNSESIEHDIKALLDHYNRIGKKYNDTALQMGLLSIFILQLLKSSNASNEEIKKVLENCKTKF